ncbi:MAG: hypothetical protein AB7G76_10670 [Steroidobacteraceae bacterium]
MNFYSQSLSVAVLVLLPAGLVLAQDKGCIELRTTAQTEQTVTGTDGKPETKLVPAATVVPGSEVIWTVSATNVCGKPAGDVAIDSPMPDHMVFIADSAVAAAFTVSYSVDGKRYDSAGALAVRNADGTTRSARPDEFRHVRYAMRAALAPGETVSATYRTRVE